MSNAVHQADNLDAYYYFDTVMAFAHQHWWGCFCRWVIDLALGERVWRAWEYPDDEDCG